jgi:hypothetical protein
LSGMELSPQQPNHFYEAAGSSFGLLKLSLTFRSLIYIIL